MNDQTIQTATTEQAIAKPLVSIEALRAAFQNIPDINVMVSLSAPAPSQTIDDVMDGEEVVGVRITFPLNPSVSAVYCGEKTGGGVAIFVFPGDDALLTATVVMALTAEVGKLGVELAIADPFAPVFHEDGALSFSGNRKDIIGTMVQKYEGSLVHLKAMQASDEADVSSPSPLVAATTTPVDGAAAND